jgi:putative transposase
VTYDPAKHHRRSIRLKGYDYAQPGAYFVTICVQGRECLLGEIADHTLRLNAIGAMVQAEWQQLPQRFPEISLDAFVIMPNHMHGLLFLAPPAGASARDGASTRDAPTSPPPDDMLGASVRAGLVPAPSEDEAPTRGAPTIGDIIGAFKSITTHAYIVGVRERGWPPFSGKFWQRNYYEHIVRDAADLARIRAYIGNNPARWALDQLHGPDR